MKISELVESARKENATGCLLLLSYFIHEKKLIELDSDVERLNVYLEDRFKNRVNDDLMKYADKIKNGLSDREVETRKTWF